MKKKRDKEGKIQPTPDFKLLVTQSLYSQDLYKGSNEGTAGPPLSEHLCATCISQKCSDE